MSRITLCSGAARIELDPEFGGAVTAFTFAAREVLRPTPPDATDAAMTAAFPLVPFPNRIAGGAFSFEGRSVRLAPDLAGGPNALHGPGWRKAWRVDALDATSVRMRLDDFGDWPWRCRAVHSLALDAGGLAVVLALTNLDLTAMPAGLGWHPAFARRGSLQLRAEVAGYYPTQDDLPKARTDLPDAWTFSTGVPAAALAPIDHCLTDWTGALRLDWPDVAARLTAPGCAFLQAYAPRGADFVCLEPQTCAPDAFNRDASFGARRLAPGETMTLRIRIDVGPA